MTSSTLRQNGARVAVVSGRIMRAWECTTSLAVNCPYPKWKGTPENQGCNIKQLVKITESKLEVYEATFFASNKSTIQKRSFKMLNNVAEVIKNHPEIKISIVIDEKYLELAVRVLHKAFELEHAG